ncbi:hypothetical protein Acsp03_26440 [Actinomadura sp. NBRC 104412]|uniref:DUF397 domain-containing protein n=1 Tax=Actinomadura sp. NBRC 104412 TaxID=3032203 RepID=UPI0024A46183|nr:DUF397 domain-containing protein [Actinomadura sp. NBRC 104412]GLZ05178.1 hypothetical protein Acsp03_26440 [Actinomadura sp. NBRC 104412]
MNPTQVEWRKASRSTAQADSCVEVAAIPSSVAVRDSKDPNGPMLVMSRQDFRRFTEALKNT